MLLTSHPSLFEHPRGGRIGGVTARSDAPEAEVVEGGRQEAAGEIACNAPARGVRADDVSDDPLGARGIPGWPIPSTTSRKPIAATAPSTSPTQEKSVPLEDTASHSRRNVTGSTLVRIMKRLTRGSLRKDSNCSISDASASRRRSEPTLMGHG